MRSNRYDLSFSPGDLGPNRLDTCAFAVSPRFDFTPAPAEAAFDVVVSC